MQEQQKDCPAKITETTLIPSADLKGIKTLASKGSNTKGISLSTRYHSPQAESGSYVGSTAYRRKAIWKGAGSTKDRLPNAAGRACSCGDLPLCSHLEVTYYHGAIGSATLMHRRVAPAKSFTPTSFQMIYSLSCV